MKRPLDSPATPAEDMLRHVLARTRGLTTWRRLWVALAGAEHRAGPCRSRRRRWTSWPPTSAPSTMTRRAATKRRSGTTSWRISTPTDCDCTRRKGHHPSGRDELLCDGQRRPYHLPRRAAAICENELKAAMQNLCAFADRVCLHAGAWLYALPARAADDRRQARGALAAGSDAGS